MGSSRDTASKEICALPALAGLSLARLALTRLGLVRLNLAALGPGRLFPVCLFLFRLGLFRFFLRIPRIVGASPDRSADPLLLGASLNQLALGVGALDGGEHFGVA